MPSASSPVPVLLLKTKSSPTDAYEELFSRAPNNSHDTSFEPTFVPVLQHKFDEAGVDKLRNLLRQKRVGTSPDCEFGGLIFTSQRAVEAFAHVVREDKAANGPATTRALAAVSQQPPLQIFGSHTGNGDALAHFILDHYAEWYAKDGRPGLPPLLFLVGEQRRDIIPRTLMDPSLPANKRIPVVEEVVYGTGEMESFPQDFAAVLDETQPSPSRWVIVFSPTGCDSMLRGLGVLDASTGKLVPGRRDGRTFVATIGPTTRSHLVKNFDFEPDVCAETPTPEGLLEGIVAFREKAS
ncbi:uroporphyrinogen-III synthase [Trichoderma asperellum]|uniref:Uroporphyrinogen-III synthase n=1 Tax=Trichoderma asperellum TaxID=101201 RepID=A0A6V8QRB6_TRIAP|nr:uroporphyrinogen-III synthase [Trichoderma asperellum]